MAKKHHLDLTGDQHLPVFIGIASRLKDYQLSFHINKRLGFHLKKLPDFTIQLPDSTVRCPYSLYRYQVTDLRMDYFLLSNHHPEAKLLPIFKQTDYFLLAAGEITANETEALIRSLRAIPDVLLAYYLDMNKVKQADLLLADLELHIMETERKD
jgi:hypothetical protein